MEGVDLHVEELRIDYPKAEYLFREHDVESFQVIEVYENRPRYFVRNTRLRTYNMVGRTFAGRWMVVSIQPVEGSVFRVVTAYWNTDGRAEKLYRGQQ